MIWGRFVYTAWKKKRVLYVLTQRRALTIVRPPQAKVIGASLLVVQSVEKNLRADGIGTITVGSSPSFPFAFGNRRMQSADGLSLTRALLSSWIENAKDVFALIEKRRDLLHSTQMGVPSPPAPPSR